MGRYTAVPLTREAANTFIATHHRHHAPVVGDIFRVGLALDGDVIGVVVVGRPVARARDDGYTAEVTRCCVREMPEAKHAASKLYGMAWRIAREMGYRRMGTYTLASESGASLRAAGWRMLHEVPGRSWDTPSRRRTDKHPTVDKTLWEVA